MERILKHIFGKQIQLAQDMIQLASICEHNNEHVHFIKAGNFSTT